MLWSSEIELLQLKIKGVFIYKSNRGEKNRKILNSKRRMGIHELVLHKRRKSSESPTNYFYPPQVFDVNYYNNTNTDTNLDYQQLQREHLQKSSSAPEPAPSSTTAPKGRAIVVSINSLRVE